MKVPETMRVKRVTEVIRKLTLCASFLCLCNACSSPTKSKRINAATPGRMTEYSRGRK